MFTARNNIKENRRSKAKSKINFHPRQLLKTRPTKKQLIKEEIDSTILALGKCTKADKTIAKKIGCSEQWVYETRRQDIREDPSYVLSFKRGFSLSINFSCLAKSSQCRILGRANSNKNNIKNSLSLSFNTPISPRGTTAVLKNKEPKERKTIKGEHESLLLRLGTQYRWHYQKQTLKFFAYPTFIVKQASEELFSAVAEYSRERQGIRSTYRYMKKICDTLMERSGLKPLWRLYYRKLAASPRPSASPGMITPSPRFAAPLSRSQPQARTSTGTRSVKDILGDYLKPDCNPTKSISVQTKTQNGISYTETRESSTEVKFDMSNQDKIAQFKKILHGASGIRDFSLRKLMAEYSYRQIFQEAPTGEKLSEYGFS